MNHVKSRTILILSLLLFMITPHIALAKPALETGVDAIADGIVFRIAYNNGTYEVYMMPSIEVAAPSLTLTSQVTIKVPHSDNDKFTIGDIAAAVEGTAWAMTSRVDAPTEDPSADYLSFEVSFPDGNNRALQWQAGSELKVFTFQTTSACLGPVSLMADSDAFAALPNSAKTNPGNQIDVLGMSNDNLFAGVVGSSANCIDQVKRTDSDYQIYLPITLK